MNKSSSLWKDGVIYHRSVHDTDFFILRSERGDGLFTVKNYPEEAYDYDIRTEASLDNGFENGSINIISKTQADKLYNERVAVQKALETGTFYIQQIKVNQTRLITPNVQVVHSPTANCQIASIANYEGIADTATVRKEKLRKLLRAVPSIKAMLLLDVHQKNESMVTDLFSGENIVLQSRYTSTNNSEMTLFLVRIRDLF